MFGSGFSAPKLKPQLKMASGRIEILKNKKTAMLKNNMRQVAQLLAEEPPKEEKARIRAEALIRDDNLIEALEIIQLECDLLHERIKLIEYSKKDCPPDLISVIATIMWSAHRVDVPELLLIRKQFRALYGKTFEDNAMNNINGCLNERVVTKLSVQPPAAYLVQTYLEKICEQFEVDWSPLMKLTTMDEMIEPMKAPQGYSVPVGQGTGLGGGGNGVPPIIPTTRTMRDGIVAHTGTSVNGLPVLPPPSSQQQQQYNQQYNQNPNYNNNNNSSIPPPIVPPPPSVITGFPNSPNGMSTITSSTGMNHPTSYNDEPDIVIAPDDIPSAPTGSLNGTGTGNTHNNNNNDDDNAGGNSGGGGGATYEDLAARFNQLQKK